jgi:hypothetical protein
MSEKLRLQEPIRSPLETPRLITPLPYRSGTSFLAWAIVNNNQPVPDVFSKMTKIAASGRLGRIGEIHYAHAKPEHGGAKAECLGHGDSGADSDDAAHLFRSDRAHHSELMPPGRECLIDGLVCH